MSWKVSRLLIVLDGFLELQFRVLWSSKLLFSDRYRGHSAPAGSTGLLFFSSPLQDIQQVDVNVNDKVAR